MKILMMAFLLGVLSLASSGAWAEEEKKFGCLESKCNYTENFSGSEVKILSYCVAQDGEDGEEDYRPSSMTCTPDSDGTATCGATKKSSSSYYSCDCNRTGSSDGKVHVEIKC